MNSNVKTANDLISDTIDAFVSGDEESASSYLDEAILMKMSDRMKECMGNLPEFQN